MLRDKLRLIVTIISILLLATTLLSACSLPDLIDKFAKDNDELLTIPPEYYDETPVPTGQREPVTDEPEESQVPFETEAPQATEVSAETEAPATEDVTATAEISETPEASQGIYVPDFTIRVEMTPNRTAAQTNSPKTTATPETTAVPKVTATPKVTQKVTPKVTAVPKASPTPKITPTPTPASKYYTAVEGYYHNETRKSVVSGVTYLNLFGTHTYYTTPATETYVPASGSGWKVKNDPLGIVKSIREENGKLIFTASSTGYVYLKNSAYETIKIYVNLPVEKTAAHKQTDKNLPYFLYYEKGLYGSKFVNGSCCLTIYRVDSEGYYTLPYITVSSACGQMSSKTPTGIHELSTRERWHDWGGEQYGQFAITYDNGVFLHAPTTGNGRRSEDFILCGSYNEIGSHASSGCLRMQTGSIYWIWSNCPTGTKLEIVNGNPRGTFVERPAAMTGSRANDAVNYDPTDPYLLVGRTVN